MDSNTHGRGHSHSGHDHGALTALAYLLLAPGASGAAALAAVIAAAWAAALAVYARRDVGRFRRLAGQLVECCRDW